MKSVLLWLIVASIVMVGLVLGQQTPRERALALVAQMSTAEKLALVHGYDTHYAGSVNANTRLRIPQLNLEDGPQGVGDGAGLVTCWPSSLAVAATWDERLMYDWAAAMGKEQLIKGTNIMLGPDINIARVPLGGRIFEMFGEDPYLTSRLVVPSVMGIQSQKVIATAKHYINNDEEVNRFTISVEVDERSNWEIYYRPFLAASKAGVGAVMCSYNKINGTYACENHQTLSDLKDVIGFQGFVMSDWGATHSTVPAANNGLDQQMPDASLFGSPLAQAVNNGQVSIARVNDMATRILTAMYAVGIMDYTGRPGDLSANATSGEHNELARTLAATSHVVLKNSLNILPLPTTGKSFAVIGDDAGSATVIAGGGSGFVRTVYTVNPLQGIQKRVGPSVKVAFAPTNPVNNAASAAAAADYAIVCVSFESSEGGDRANLALPGNQNALIAAVAAAQRRTIVVLHGPGPVLMPWADSVAAIVFAWFPGQESGNALASVLFGDVNPSARLPVTFPVNENDWFSGQASQYPGVNLNINYSEKLLVGYRWYDARKIKPLFPFGHGLSYTTFSYTDLKISATGADVMVSLSLANTGKLDGDEIVQLYLGFPASAQEPPQVLRGFQKVHVPAGTQQQVVLGLTADDLSIWDTTRRGFVVPSGTFTVYVGASSRDIQLTGTFTI